MSAILGGHRARTVWLLAKLAVVFGAAGGAEAQFYRVTNLVSDGTIPAAHTDPNLVNGWGLAFNPTGFAWVADNGTGLATLYDGNGVPQSLVVEIPSPNSDDPAPTGNVFSGGAGFVVDNGQTSGPARFIFSTERGVIAAWAPTVDMTHALIPPTIPITDAIYKGLALAGTGSSARLYATDFHNAKIDVYDDGFNPITVPGGFADPGIPAGFAPFGIQAIGDTIFVTYAKQDADREDELHGPGLGFVNAFDLDGNRIARVASRGKLNAPWGIVMAPHNFGRFSDDLLIGNFGDGRINAYEVRHEHGPGDQHGHGHHERPAYRFDGQLKMRHGGPVEIDGLWGIAFGNGVQNQPTNTLFFASGPDDEMHGLYGRIDVDPHH